jgi:N6-L-threonylcarbamoyladenine synthase
VRAALEAVAATHALPFIAPPLKLCTDNAAMIAAHAFFTAESAPTNSLEVNAVATWEMGGSHNF